MPCRGFRPDTPSMPVDQSPQFLRFSRRRRDDLLIRLPLRSRRQFGSVQISTPRPNSLKRVVPSAIHSLT